MFTKKSKNTTAILTVTAVILLSSPGGAADREAGRERVGAHRNRAQVTQGWLAEAWRWLTSVWGENGGIIDPNGGKTIDPAPAPAPAPAPLVDPSPATEGIDSAG